MNSELNKVITLHENEQFPFVQLLGNHIIKINYGPHYEITKSDLKKITEIVNFYESKNPELIKILSLFGKFTTITLEARTYVEHATVGIKAEAFVLNQLQQKIIGNFYKTKRDHPVKLFTDENEALAWLKQI